jgi:hypothetical protein
MGFQGPAARSGFVEMAEVSDVAVAFGLLNNNELQRNRNVAS